jgi:hypothetical protein
VQQLIERLDPQKTNRVEIHDIEPFTQFYKGRVVLWVMRRIAPHLILGKAVSGDGGCDLFGTFFTDQYFGC